jgi:hypothetical protein
MKVEFKVGDRVTVFLTKEREWRPGRILSTTKTGANVKLDAGHDGYFYWSCIQREKKQKQQEWRNPIPLELIKNSEAPAADAPSEAGIEDPMRSLGDLLGRAAVRVVVLTPELASELLSRNEKNRRIRPNNLKKLKDALAGGRWKFNGDTVCVSKSGLLIDGQHRCKAVSETGIPIIVILVEGLDDDVFDTKDIGAQRNAADVLNILGETDCRTLAAALNWVSKYYRGKMTDTDAVPPYSIDELLDEHRGLADSVKLVRANRDVLVPAALLAALHYLFSHDDRGQADRFLNDLAKGVGLADTDGVYHLRERMMKNRVSKAKLPHPEIAALTIKAWNARRRGAEVRTLRWRNDKDAPEPFPMIHGGVRIAS